MTKTRGRNRGRGALLVLCLLATSHGLLADPGDVMPAGDAAWLRYSHIRPEAVRQRDEQQLPATVVALQNDLPIVSAQRAIVRGVRGMLDRILRQQNRLSEGDAPDGAIVLGTTAAVRHALPALALPADLRPDGYWLKTATVRGHPLIVITSPQPRGVLYGAFALLRRMAMQLPVAPLDEESNPAAPVRWVNEWDNLTGTIKRGYGGRSIFFENGHVVRDLSRASAYAHLLASVGINGCTVNNVNSDPRILTPEFIGELARIADVFRPWGVRLSIAVDFSRPEKIGGLSTFDPLDPQVAAWWKQKADEVYRAIPDLGGFLVKVDSEGRLGHDPHRIEAESMQLDGYQMVEVHPLEAASDSRGITCPSSPKPCTARFRYSGKPGWFDIGVQYFDQNNDDARFQLLLNGVPIDAWTANDHLPSRHLDADTSTRHTVSGVALRPGDTLEIQGSRQGGDSASVDYVTLHSSRP